MVILPSNKPTSFSNILGRPYNTESNLSRDVTKWDHSYVGLRVMLNATAKLI